MGRKYSQPWSENVCSGRMELRTFTARYVAVQVVTRRSRSGHSQAGNGRVWRRSEHSGSGELLPDSATLWQETVESRAAVRALRVGQISAWRRHPLAGLGPRPHFREFWDKNENFLPEIADSEKNPENSLTLQKRTNSMRLLYMGRGKSSHYKSDWI